MAPIGKSASPRTAEAVDEGGMQFDAVIDKTDKGFGIYFARVATTDGDLLTVDGFVEEDFGTPLPSEDIAKQKNTAMKVLKLGDVLVGVNGNNCRGREVAYILGLLRSAGVGENMLSFARSLPTADPSIATNPLRSSTGGLMGALRKVKSKIQAEMEGGEDELLREQLEDKRFERQWLEEFEGLKKQYETKWETCTYTADEFCGLLYRSSNARQKEFLLREYPTLMGAWENYRATTTSSRIIPEWTASKVAYESTVVYQSSVALGASVRSVHCSQSLQRAIGCLRKDFMWRADAVRSFSRRLEVCGISSCAGFLEVIDARSGYFERNFQSKHYPRLSKAVLRTLRTNAQNENATCSASYADEQA